MRRLSLARRRKQNRVASAIERVAVRVLTAVWFVRMLLRHGRPSIR